LPWLLGRCWGRRYGAAQVQDQVAEQQVGFLFDLFA